LVRYRIKTMQVQYILDLVCTEFYLGRLLSICYQFHQCFTQTFCADILSAKNFKPKKLLCNFLRQNIAKNVHVKCWWNWLLMCSESTFNFCRLLDGPSTWLPVNPNYVDVNVEAQLSAEESHIKIYQVSISSTFFIQKFVQSQTLSREKIFVRKTRA